MKKLESNFLSFHLYYYLLKIFCQIRGSRIQKMIVKGFSITLWVQKMMVKGFSITWWIQKMMVKGFSIIFWRPFVCSSLTSFFNLPVNGKLRVNCHNLPVNYQEILKWAVNQVKLGQNIHFSTFFGHFWMKHPN